MKESKLLNGLMATVAVIALSAPAAAFADAKGELQGVSVKVSYADLDLEKHEGASTLYRRLQQASKEVCDVRGMNGSRSIRRLAESKRCYRDALSEAVASIDNDLLTQIQLPFGGTKETGNGHREAGVGGFL